MYKNSKYIYKPNATFSFRLSRSKIGLYLECPQCFYLDRRLGIPRPSMPGFSLNQAVDTLLKKEFDILRQKGEAHELMKHYRIDAIPLAHPDLDIWRDTFKGKEYYHQPTNLIITGAVDDLWVNPKGELIVVDYKATSTANEISLEDEYKQGYKKQLEVYQWIFRRSGFPVAPTGYFVFANAGRNRPSFDGKLEFELSLVAYTGDDSWVEPTIMAIKKCLDSDAIPDSSLSCEYCAWRQAAQPGGQTRMQL